MTSAGEIYLGISGSEVLLTAASRKFSIRPEEIVREGRTASGRLVQDVIAVKNNYTLSYDLIGGTDLSTFLIFYSLNQELSLIYYSTDESSVSTTVIMRPIQRERVLLDTIGGGLWSGVTIELAEV